MLKEAQKEGEISEDDGHRAQETMQELANEYIEKINQVLSGKEDEIMEV
jgi:ribosome recycling factor